MSLERKEYQKVDQALQRVDYLGEELSKVKDNGFRDLIHKARIVNELRQILMNPDILKVILELKGSGIGFETDKDREQEDHDRNGDGIKCYSDQQIVDCVIEARSKGVYPTNREFMVIGGKPYIQEQGYDRLLQELPQFGALEIRIDYESSKLGNAGAMVDVTVDFQWQNKRHQRRWTLPVRVNAGQGWDAIQGKVHRKVKARIYRMITRKGMIYDLNTHKQPSEAIDVQKVDQYRDDLLTDPIENPTGKLSDDLFPKVKEIIEDIGEHKVNQYLVSTNLIRKGQAWKDLSVSWRQWLVEHENEFRAKVAGK